jgi:probable rRNA maturation factor
MIFIDNRQNKIDYNKKIEELLINVIEYTLREESVLKEFEVSIILVDNEGIRELNNEFRNIDSSTDVLSFPMLDFNYGKVYKEVYKDFDFDDTYLDNGMLILGDMALSLEKALDQSREYAHSFNREIAYLTVHSMLHLLGYDHIKESDKLTMRKREEEILAKLDLQRKSEE